MDSSEILGSLLGFILFGGALIAFVALIFGLINLSMYIFNRLIQGGRRIYLVYAVITVEAWNNVASRANLSGNIEYDLIKVIRILFATSDAPVSWRKAKRLARQEKLGYVLLREPASKPDDAVNAVLAYLVYQGISAKQWSILQQQRAYAFPSKTAPQGHASLVVIGYLPTPLPFVILPKPSFD